MLRTLRTRVRGVRHSGGRQHSRPAVAWSARRDASMLFVLVVACVSGLFTLLFLAIVADQRDAESGRPGDTAPMSEEQAESYAAPWERTAAARRADQDLASGAA